MPFDAIGENKILAKISEFTESGTGLLPRASTACIHKVKCKNVDLARLGMSVWAFIGGFYAQNLMCWL